MKMEQFWDYDIKLPVVAFGVTWKHFELKHQKLPGDVSLKKKTSEHIWQSQKGLVTSSRLLSIFIRMFITRDWIWK